MFSNWFSGDERGQYRTSPHKQRMDPVGSSLLELRYANDVIRQHLHEWLRFSRHLEECGLPLLATDTDSVRQYVARRTAKTSASRSRVLRASVRIFLDTDERGQFRRRVGSPPVTPDWFAPILTPYLLFVQTHRGLAAKTARKYTQKLSAFAQYLEGAGVTELDRITPGHVREFYENAKKNAPRRSYGSTLRVFFRWASGQGWLSSSLRDAVPRPRQYRYVNLPDVLGPTEVDRVLAAVDLSTPLGRRDYAVLVLAARYGLRPCDIRKLTLDEIDWREARIDLRQGKTGRPLVLPLLPDVAGALSAYLLDGRPVSTTAPSFCATVHRSSRSRPRTTSPRSCATPSGASALPTDPGAADSTYFAIRWRLSCWLPGSLLKQSPTCWATRLLRPPTAILGSRWTVCEAWPSPRRR